MRFIKVIMEINNRIRTLKVENQILKAKLEANIIGIRNHDDVIHKLRRSMGHLEVQNDELKDKFVKKIENMEQYFNRLIHDLEAELEHFKRSDKAAVHAIDIAAEILTEYYDKVKALEVELSARKEDSESLMKVVDVIRNDTIPNSKVLCMICSIVEDYLDAPEPPIDEDGVLVDQIAKTLHEMFSSMIQKRQMNGSIPSGATDIVTYDKLTDSSKEYLHDQVDKILKLVNQ